MDDANADVDDVDGFPKTTDVRWESLDGWQWQW
jgi:hypothetical protein